MADVYDEVTHWSKGVITSAEADRADLLNAMVRGDNAMFTSVAGGIAQVRKRLGMTLLNETPLNNAAGVGPAVIAGFPYRYQSGGTTTRYTVALTSTGNVHFLTDDGAATNLTPSFSSAAALGTGLNGGDSASMNNRLFLLDRVGGQAAFLGAAKTNWGVTVPAGLALTTPAAGVMTGTYSVVVTAWDETLRAESNRSASVQITATAQNIRVSVTAVAVGLTNMHFRVYLRNDASGDGLWRVLTGTGYVGGTVMGYPLFSGGATVTTDINISAATLLDLVLPVPLRESRGVPPATARYAAVWQRRLFLADEGNLYWSELDLPDAFNPRSTEPIASPRGGSIVGLVPMADGQGLHIWTETGRHSIIGGADPQGWTIDIEDPAIGAVSRGGLVPYRRFVAAWDADHGPILLAASGEVAYIGTDYIREDVKPSALAMASTAKWVSAAYDGRILFGVVEGGQTLVQRLLVFNVEMGAWESTNWDPMDVASLFVSYDTSGTGRIYLGNQNGQIFRLMAGGTDGVRTGTVRGTFVAATASVTLVEDVTASFDTTGAALRQRRVRFIASDGQVVESPRAHIASNTLGGFTLNVAITGLTVDATYTYVIGGPDFLFESYWGNLQLPFIDKRFDELLTEFRADDGVNNVAIRMAFAWDATRVVNAATFDQGTSLWDAVDWDVATWDGQAEFTKRLGIFKRGRNYRIQLRNPYPNQGFTVLKLAVLGRRLSSRYLA